ncbi:MAG: efflux RND transporter periplasmic adaptor subunit [Acidaminobacteraceae bacterium]
MNRKFNIIILVIAMTLLLSACSSNEAVEEITENSTRVQVSMVKSDNIIEKIPGLGSFEAFTKLEVLASGSGEIKELKVKAGDKVKKGQMLFTLDNDTALINYNLVESQLRTLKDNLKTQFDDLKLKYDQQQALYNVGSISKSELDNIASQLSQIENQYNDSVNNYNNQKRNLANSIKDRSFKSPVDGTVAIVYIKENESVNNKLALEIINDDDMVFKVMVTGDTLDQIKIGTKTNIYIDGDKSKVVSGEVVKYNEISDASSGLYEVVVLVNNNEGFIRSGSYGENDFIKDTRAGLLIEKKAIIREDEDEYIYIIDGEIAKKIKIITGITVNKYVEVIEGVSADMLVVTIGQNYLSDMEKVIVLE